MTEPKRSAPRYVTRNSVGPNQPTPWQVHHAATAGKPAERIKATQDQYLWAVLDRPPQVPGSRYTGKRGDDGRPLCTAKAEYTRFDWAQDCYGAHIRVHFLHRLRAEQKFASLDALRAQIALDSQAARDWLAANPLPA